MPRELISAEGALSYLLEVRALAVGSLLAVVALSAGHSSIGNTSLQMRLLLAIRYTDLRSRDTALRTGRRPRVSLVE